MRLLCLPLLITQIKKPKFYAKFQKLIYATKCIITRRMLISIQSVFPASGKGVIASALAPNDSCLQDGLICSGQLAQLDTCSYLLPSKLPLSQIEVSGYSIYLAVSLKAKNLVAQPDNVLFYSNVI